MAAENYFGDSMTATVDTEDATPVSVPVGSLKQVNIAVEAEHIELDSADTILREDVAKRNFSVSVTVGIAAFDPVLIQEWLGGDGTAATSPTDDNSVATFDIVGTVTSSDGTTTTATVDSVYFPNLPVFNAQEGQWIQWDLQGTGKTITMS